MHAYGETGVFSSECAWKLHSLSPGGSGLLMVTLWHIALGDDCLLGDPYLGFFSHWLYFLVSASRLPSIIKLNGSIVGDGEREDSERFFIRYYMEFPEEEVPFRYEAFVLEWRTGSEKAVRPE